jgi:hypothetical protein
MTTQSHGPLGAVGSSQTNLPMLRERKSAHNVITCFMINWRTEWLALAVELREPSCVHLHQLIQFDVLYKSFVTDMKRSTRVNLARPMSTLGYQASRRKVFGGYLRQVETN